MHGYSGRVLRVDLTSGRSAHRDLEESRLRITSAASASDVSLLWEYAPAGVDPLSPRNPVIFASAPLVGTGLTTTAKFAVVTKSPLTGFVADSLSSSYFALELKRLGIDALVVTGRAAVRSTSFDPRREGRDRAAKQLRGRARWRCESLIRSEGGAPGHAVAAIGAAGENGVRFAHHQQ